MKFNEIQEGRVIQDRWWPDWGPGRVVLITLATVHVQFSDKKLVYDKDHVQFLEEPPNALRR